MSKSDNCNLIEDLLPLYIEGLVSEETKKKIEEHLKKCDKCSEILKSINKDEEIIIEEQKDNSSNEVKCIKNIKRKIMFKIVMAVLITAISIISVFGIYILSPYRFIRDENEKLILYNSNTGNIKKGKESTNAIATYTLNYNGKYIEKYIVLTFDKNDICINARTIISGFTENDLDNYKNAWEKNNVISNTKTENGKLYMNDNSYIGKNKQELLESLKTSYKAEITEI